MYWEKVTMKRQPIQDLVFVVFILLASQQISKTESRVVGCGSGGKPADVVFLLDGSNSIWRPHFRRQLQFVKDMIDFFSVGRDDMRVAVITYADYPQIQFQLHYHLTKPQLHAAVDAIRQIGGYRTKTGQALRYARENVLRVRGDVVRTNVTKVVVVITDGLSDNRTATALEAERTKADGIHVFAVGVGKEVDLEELDAIASVPSKYYTFLVDGYEGLVNVLELLAIKTCTVTDPTTTTASTTTTATTASTTTTATSAPTTMITTTASTSTTATTASSTTTIVSSTYAMKDNDSESIADRKNQTNDEDDDDDDSVNIRNETMRTPSILQPPNFVPDPPETPFMAEFKIPNGGRDNMVDASNCSEIKIDRWNETEDDDKEDRHRDKTEDSQIPTYVPHMPCVSNGSETDGNPGNSHPKFGKIDSNSTGDESGNINNGAQLEFNEYGYWIGTHFVKTGNGSSRGSDSDTEPLIGRQDVVHQNVTRRNDTNRVIEDNGRHLNRTKGNPDGKDPRYHVYLSSGPWGTGGYWYRDDELGYLWYRYVGPGEFELDLDTTYEMRRRENGGERNDVTGMTGSGKLSSTTSGDGFRVTPDPLQDESIEGRSRPRDEEDSRTVPQKIAGGYWGKDEMGNLVWYRLVREGVFQKLYPTNVDQSVGESTDRNGDDAEKSTPITTSGFKVSHHPYSQRPSSVEYEESYTTTTPSDPSSSQRPKDGGEASVGLRQSPEDIEYDFWRFVSGRRVWFQYVPPNGLDDREEEERVGNSRNPTNAVEIPLDLEGVGTVRNGTQRESRWKFGTEKRRVWHSSRSLRNDSVTSEELLVDSDSSDDSATIRLDDEKGRHLWKQLVNLTNPKLSGNSFSDLKSRFAMLSDGLRDRDSDRDSGENQPDQFHESYWFYDDTGRRFQVIHRYNKSTADGDKTHAGEHPSLSEQRFLPEQIPANINWEHGETEVHGRPLEGRDGVQEYENYGGEYWIRALGSSRDDFAIRKPVDVEALHSRTVISTNLLDKNTVRPRQEAITYPGKHAKDRIKEDKGRKHRAGQKINSLLETGSRKPNETRSTRRHNRKGCRSKRPIDMIFTIHLDKSGANEDHMQSILNITEVTAAILTSGNPAGVQVRYYPEIHDDLVPERIPKTPDGTSSGKKKTLSEIFSDISRMFSKNASERKRSGKTRTRKILVVLTDGQPENPSSGRFRSLHKDVEFYWVGFGERANIDHLQSLAKWSKSKHTHVIPASTSDDINTISNELTSTMCRALGRNL